MGRLRDGICEALNKSGYRPMKRHERRSWGADPPQGDSGGPVDSVACPSTTIPRRRREETTDHAAWKGIHARRRQRRPR